MSVNARNQLKSLTEDRNAFIIQCPTLDDDDVIFAGVASSPQAVGIIVAHDVNETLQVEGLVTENDILTHESKAFIGPQGRKKINDAVEDGSAAFTPNEYWDQGYTLYPTLIV